jgi:hypothetical protein
MRSTTRRRLRREEGARRARQARTGSRACGTGATRIGAGGGAPPTGTRGGMIQTVQGNRWIVTLAGAARDYPPTDEAAFLEFARSLPQPDLYEAIRAAEPLTPVAGSRQTGNRLRHYERLPRWPRRFIVLGDAVCSLNPVYSQGLTVAALAALTLDQSLRHRSHAVGTHFARGFQRALARTTSTPWLLATLEDFRHPTTAGSRPDVLTHLVHAYIDRLQVVATRSPAAHQALIATLNLLSPPLKLIDPRLALRVLTTR